MDYEERKAAIERIRSSPPDIYKQVPALLALFCDAVNEGLESNRLCVVALQDAAEYQRRRLAATEALVRQGEVAEQKIAFEIEKQKNDAMVWALQKAGTDTQ